MLDSKPEAQLKREGVEGDDLLSRSKHRGKEHAVGRSDHGVNRAVLAISIVGLQRGGAGGIELESAGKKAVPEI